MVTGDQLKKPRSRFDPERACGSRIMPETPYHAEVHEKYQTCLVSPRTVNTRKSPSFTLEDTISPPQPKESVKEVRHRT